MVRQCPICKSKDYEVLTQLCSNMQILGPQFNEEKTNLVCCKECGLVYVDIDASQEKFNQYYMSDYSHSPSYDELYTPEVKMQYFEDWLNEIKPYINSESYILDVGGGLGQFGQYLMQQGYKNVYVLDINEKDIEIIKKLGVNPIQSDTIHFDESLRQKFDMVMFSNSLEHFYELDKGLLAGKEMMKDDGHLFIELPNAGKYCDIKNSPFMLFTYEHLYHFTKTMMKNVANALGFDVIALKEDIKCGGFNVIRTVFKKSAKTKTIVYDDSTKKACLKYIEHSINELFVVKELEKSQEKVILWGVGASTALLLNKIFDNCNVIQVVDRNKERQKLRYEIGGKMFNVQDPSDIKDTEATIVVLPFWYRMSISKQIKEMGFKNPVKMIIK